MKRMCLMGLVLVAILALAVFPVGARPPSLPSPAGAGEGVVADTSSLANFLLFLTSTGGLAMILSFVQERSAWFKSQEARVKVLVTLGVCTLIPAAAFLILTYVPANVLASLDPIFKVVAMGLTMFISSQVYHGMNKAA